MDYVDRCFYNCDNGLCHNRKMKKEYCDMMELNKDMSKCKGYWNGKS